MTETGNVPRERKKFSVIIPVYNEVDHLHQTLKDIAFTPTPEYIKEIIVLDDGSTDGSTELLHEIEQKINSTGQYQFQKGDREVSLTKDQFQMHYNSRNLGKGATVTKGFEKASGDVIVIQDADRELNPAALTKLLNTLEEESVNVVYGSRFMKESRIENIRLIHKIGNQFLTFLSNCLTNFNLTDMETGYKMFRADVLDKLDLREARFGFEPEITAKLSNADYTITEVPVNFNARSRQDGKKMKWWYGFRAIYCILKYNLRPYINR